MLNFGQNSNSRVFRKKNSEQNKNHKPPFKIHDLTIRTPRSRKPVDNPNSLVRQHTEHQFFQVEK